MFLPGHRLARSALAGAFALSLSWAQAGTFNTVTFGPIKAADIRDLVPDAFTRRYPAEKWAVLVFADAGMASNGTPYCYAIAGLTPKGADKFPVNRYTHFIQSPDAEVMTVAKKRAWAVACARHAVENMMTDDLDTLYEADEVAQPRKVR